MAKKSYTGWMIFGGIVLVLLLLVGWFVGTYNSIVGLDATVVEQWANVETQYQRRMDLIPNLVETVKGVANFETSTYTAVTEARTKWLNSQGDVNAQIQAAGEFDSALSRLLVMVENYPQLKANENFLSLQDELAGTENRVAVARRDFNAAVKEYNTRIRQIPANIVAGFGGFTAKTSFEAAQGAENAPKVEF